MRCACARRGVVQPGHRPPAQGHVAADRSLGRRLPTAAFNGGTIVNPDGSVLVAHYLPVPAALIALALFADQPEVEIWVFSGGDWLLKDPHGPMVPREQHGLGYPPVVVESFEPFLERIDKIVATSNNTDLLIELEARLLPKVNGMAQVSRSQPVYLDVTALEANKGTALSTIAAHLGIPLEQTAAIGDGGNDPAMFHCAGIVDSHGAGGRGVKRQADVVTAPNTEDGVALAIEKYILP
jgi:hydroxymethylpyrimidine pyrophosphatase-like HAD family hydrolase